MKKPFAQTCLNCERYLPLDSFTPNWRLKFGREAQCRYCKEIKRQNRLGDKASLKAAQDEIYL